MEVLIYGLGFVSNLGSGGKFVLDLVFSGFVLLVLEIGVSILRGVVDLYCWNFFVWWF